MSGVRAAIVHVCVAFALVSAPATAADLPLARHVPVAVCSFVPVSREVIVAAEQIADDVFRDIGVEIEWLEDRCSPMGHRFSVTLTSRQMTDTEVANNTLGFAEPGTVAATVLFDRVHAYARRYRIKCEVLLGYAIAHELGHLLLPPKSHSATGLMRAVIDLEMASTRRLRFSAEQAALIVQKLEVDPNYTVAARPQNVSDASRAPSAIASSLPQTTSGSTAAWPTHVP